MSLEIVKKTVVEQHAASPFERDRSKIRGSLDLLAHRLGQVGVNTTKCRGVIVFKHEGFELDDGDAVWLIAKQEGITDTDETTVVIDPHLPTTSLEHRLTIKDYVTQGDNRLLKKAVTELLPSDKAFPLGRSHLELQEVYGVNYRAQPMIK
jgi:hypothetical protein